MAAKKVAAKRKPQTKNPVAKKSAVRKAASNKEPRKKPPAKKAPAKPSAAKRSGENKTTANSGSVERYIAAITTPARRKDCEALCALMAEASGHPPKMWGTAIVGFGSYHYRYDSGREGDSPLVGFSSRASEIAIYGLRAAPLAVPLLAKLGKHKEATSCVYVKAMSDVDTKVLAELVSTAAVAKKKEDVGA